VIAHNSLTDEKIFPIVGSIPSNLMYIDISGNPNLTYKAYEALCATIGRDNQLLSIGMEDNQCGDEVVRLMCEVVAANQKITELKLSKNKVTNKGAEYISSLL
jgi:hypothetical protein